MGYTPKHAKPASSLNEEATTDSRRHALFAISGPSKGRHAAPESGQNTRRQDEGSRQSTGSGQDEGSRQDSGGRQSTGSRQSSGSRQDAGNGQETSTKTLAGMKTPKIRTAAAA